MSEYLVIAIGLALVCGLVWSVLSAAEAEARVRAADRREAVRREQLRRLSPDVPPKAPGSPSRRVS